MSTNEPITNESTPADLPKPVDDGAADHLTGVAVPHLTLPSTSGDAVELAAVRGTWVLFVYPSTGVPGQELPEGWDDVPGARGCTPEACGFRDNFEALQSTGIAAVYGLSMQSTDVQTEAAERLQLPYPLLSDSTLDLAGSLGLPTFVLHGITYYRRLTLIIGHGVIEHVFYPVFPTATHASDVTTWLHAR
ncbi:peroxiredoxin [Spelaeicoccus albus]|uniref:Peroxiredoxin n=1 Tax=Spelaeicoccus albus TaxID=1280376 RepID=A0A7Z0D197_9MICO|nr:peroxiredoxin [Spelaeicoccus albus]NYI66623.1 peroxiredoxin [Spelaeicoccus albus]